MSVLQVRAFLSSCAPDIEVVELEKSTATVVEAAEAFGVVPGQIAKTLSLYVEDRVALLVMSGDAKLHNKKFKDTIGVKPKMLKFDDVASKTGFQPGGVCPFTREGHIDIYCDESLKQYEEVLPAGGSSNSGVRISPLKLAEICQATWVDVAKFE